VNKTEAYIALAAMIVAIANIFFLIFKAPVIVISAFSFAMSIAVLYFSYRELIVMDIFKQIRNIMITSAVDNDVKKAVEDSREAMKNATNPFEEK
jgi:hypothetical protein